MKSKSDKKEKKFEEKIKFISEMDEKEFYKFSQPAGFSEQETRNRKIINLGTNKIITKKFNFFKEYFASFLEPFNIFLLFVGLIEVVLYIFKKETDYLFGSILIFFMIILASITDYIQEYKSYKINSKLNTIVENKYWLVDYSLISDKKWELKNLLENKQEINEDKITIGDYIYLSAGDVIPTECRIIWSKNLFVDQSTLTGESEPIYKEKNLINKSNFIYYDNILYSQTIVKSGMCIAVVVTIGEEKYSNYIINMADNEKEKSYFEKGISQITKIIFSIMLVTFIIILISSGFKTGQWVNSIILALSVMVALTPEALPAIISGNLQLGSQILKKNKVVVKKIDIIQNMGSLNIMATDKTGTLTEDKLIFTNFCDLENDHNSEVEKYFYLNSKFHSLINNNIDKGILEKLDKENININNYLFVDEIAFDHAKRISSIIVKNLNQQCIETITKGSVKEILNISTHYKIKDNIHIINDKFVNDLINIENSLAEKGKRILLLSCKKSIDEKETSNIVIIGYAIFEDKIKEGIEQAINNIYDNNIELKILSGDNVDVTRKVANKIKIKNEMAISGHEFEIKHKELNCEKINIFAKLDPMQKGEIIKCLKENKNVVGYLGDGVNDVYALKTSDVGISVNNATSSAKQAADIIMLEKDINVLNNAFRLGRKTFVNAIKFIKLTLATNIGLMLSLLIASIWFSFEAMNPMQLLIQNLLFDFSNLIFIFDNVDEISIKKPKKLNIKSFISFSFFVGMISMLISLTNFLILNYGYDYKTITNSNDIRVNNFQTIYFLETFITHMFLILVERTELISFFKSNASWKLFLGIGILFSICLFLVYTPYVKDFFSFSMSGCGWWWFILLGLLFEIWILGEAFKKIYIKIFKTWF